MLAGSLGATPFADSICKRGAMAKRCGGRVCTTFATVAVLGVVKQPLVTVGELILSNLTARGLPGGHGILGAMGRQLGTGRAVGRLCRAARDAAGAHP